ncbi:MAG: hypothetical protein AVO35_08355 [Candidatus Aegiribacteria sp. MLS_C]|nr:MAG: hypothetical protein AVO35_08355 [Candidatus Aegiribacteria sp. MLS_C]
MHQYSFYRSDLTKRCGAVSLLLLPVLLLIPAASWGYGFHDALTYGNTIDVISIRSAAMVGIRVFGSSGASAVFMNPSNLHYLPTFHLEVSTSAVSWTEEVVDSTSVVQRSDRGLGSLSGAAACRLGSRTVVGIGLAKVSDFQYNGTHFLPENPSHPGIDIIETLNATGGLWEALCGFSWSPSEYLSAGVSGGLRFGEVTYDYSYDEKFTPEVDSSYTWSWDLSEPCFHAGAEMGDEVLGAGVCYTSGTSDRYHDRLSIAGRATAEHIGNTTMIFEGEIVAPFDRNYFKGKLGIETPIRRSISLLAGVGFNEGENMNRVGMAFSVGGNYRTDRFTLDLALSNINRSRVSTSFPEEYSDYVDDSWTQFCIGLNYLI